MLKYFRWDGQACRSISSSRSRSRSSSAGQAADAARWIQWVRGPPTPSITGWRACRAVPPLPASCTTICRRRRPPRRPAPIRPPPPPSCCPAGSCRRRPSATRPCSHRSCITPQLVIFYFICF